MTACSVCSGNERRSAYFKQIFALLAKLRDSWWRSDHQVIPCRAWVVRNVVDEHIRLCAIAGTKINKYLDDFFSTNNL